MRKLTKLKLIILENGLTQREIARKSGIDEATLSLIATGRYAPDPIQKARIAQAIQKPESTLFSDNK